MAPAAADAVTSAESKSLREIQCKFKRAGETPALLRLADGAEVNAELLAFFVEVAAFEAEGFRGVGHVVMMQLQFGEQSFAFESFDALGERPCSQFGWRMWTREDRLRQRRAARRA